MKAYYLKPVFIQNSKGGYLLFFVIRSWDEEIINGFSSYRKAEKRVDELNAEHFETFGVEY